MAPQEVSVRYWDNHFHGRLSPVTEVVMPQLAKRVCGGCAEPNTKDPHLTTYDDVCRYLEALDAAAPGKQWVASIYLTREPDLESIRRCWEERLISHIKHYPTGGSTHTEESPSVAEALDKDSMPGKALCLAQEMGLPLKRHAEETFRNGIEADPYQREAIDLAENEPRFMETYPLLKRILAHLSTREGAIHMHQFGDPSRYIGEVTSHHGWCDRRITRDGGALIVDHHCLPPVQDMWHLEGIQNLLRDRPPYIVAGSDAAGHLTGAKYCFCAFGGFYTYHCALELYIQTLDALGILDWANDFLYGNAKRFHGDLVPDNPSLVTLVKEPWAVTERIPVREAADEMTPFGFHPDPDKRFEFQWQIKEAA